ncbi:hypothetical protein KPL71_023968 [Citrus sinensis]|uniref:Uncharacterized protein n=1 Tax=Citrus sinensis TaxID=2711 RepID=A0ACB8IN16_CITSI|nr:hypothetical protein KPL71_023968 [Citrus sinensis]
MAKKTGKKIKDQGSSINQSKKKIVKALKIVKKKLNIKASAVPSDGPSSESKLPDVTPTTVMTSSIVARGNEGASRRNPETEIAEQTSGFIFMCNGKTKSECYRYRVFGLPTGKLKLVEKIKPGSTLFLFDFDLKLLYGVYIATSEGELGLEPTAFSGRFPAQVKFRIFMECLPLPEKVFREAIKNDYQGSKFRQDLSGEQVKNLVALFRPICASASAAAANTLQNVASPHTSRALVVPERFQPRARLTSPHGSYLPGIHHGCAFQIPLYQSEKTIIYPPYDQYKSGACGGLVQPPAQLQLVVQQAAHPHPMDPYYLTEGHQPYVPENPGHQPYVPENPSTHILGPYGRNLWMTYVISYAMLVSLEGIPPNILALNSYRYRQNMEVVHRELVPGYEREYHTFLSAENKEIDQHSQNVVNCYSQNQPPAPALSHTLLQTNAQGEHSQNVVRYYSRNLAPASASLHALLHAYAQGENSQNTANYYNQNLPPASASSHDHLQTNAQGEHSQNMANYYCQNLLPAPALSQALLQTNAQGEHSQNTVNYYSQNLPPASASSHDLLHTSTQGENSQNMVNYYSPNVPPASAYHAPLQTDAQEGCYLSYQPH